MKATNAICKICSLCGESCADRPRVKDPRGRYYCRTCHDAAAERRRLAEIMDDLPEAPGMLDTTPIEPPESPEPEAAPAAATTALPPFHPRLSREDLRRQSDEVARKAYLTPILMFLVGAGAIFVIQTLAVGEMAGVAYLLTFLFSVPVGLAVFLVCSWLWIGHDAPLPLTVIRLAGIYAVADLCLFIPFAGWLVSALVYVGLLSSQLELDLVDAVAVAVLTCVIKVVMFVVAVAWLVTALA